MGKKRHDVIRAYKDTRGLPPYLDPRYFYVYATQERHKQATGLEGLLHKYLPQNLFASVAFAIDPWSEFKVSLGKISPALRIRSRKVNSILNQRKLVRKIDNWATYKGYAGPQTPGQWIDQETVHSHTGSATYTLTSQEPLEWFSSDTTSRTRVAGSSQGEFSKWKVSIESPGYTIYRSVVGNFWYSWSPSGYHYTTYGTESNQFTTPAARILSTTVSNLYTSEAAAALALMQKQSLSLYKGLLPTHRTYTLFRNLVELRDLPRGIATFRDTAKHLSQLYATRKVPDHVMKQIASFGTTLSDIPKEWLSYAFGWRQMYRDLVDLLAAPQKIGRKTDLLIRRGAKPTTYRTKRDYESFSTASSGFTYDSNWLETQIGSLEHSIVRKTQLRMVVNTTIEFPPIDVPRLRSKEFYRQLGVTPTFTDIYNLVPWSWLVDWFTGLGDYVEIIDNINSDPKLINWGVLTADVQGTLRTHRRTKSTNEVSWKVNSDPGTYLTSTLPHDHISSLHYSFQSRKSLASLFDVNIATDVTTLSLYQQSILAALVSARTRYRR